MIFKNKSIKELEEDLAELVSKFKKKLNFILNYFYFYFKEVRCHL